MNVKPNWLRLPLAAAISALSPIVAYAQQAPANDSVEEVFVSAKQQETLKNAPVSVKVLSEDFLKQNNINSLEQIGDITPGLSISSEGVISQRGITTSVLGLAIEQSSAIYVDGVRLSGSTHVLGNVQDLASIEILNGPQGTRVGGSAPAGAILLTTNKPTDTFSGDVSGGIGSNNLRYVKSTLNIPITESLLSRTSVYKAKDAGAFGNKSGGKRFASTDDTTVRTQLRWLINQELTADFALDASNLQGNRNPGIVTKSTAGAADPALDPLEFLAPDNLGRISDTRFPNTNVIYDSNGNTRTLQPGDDFNRIFGSSAKFTWDLNESLSLTSITSYRKARMEGLTGSTVLVRTRINDGFGGFLPAGPQVATSVSDVRTHREEAMQEFRLDGYTHGISWTTGVNYSLVENEGRTTMALPAYRNGLNPDGSPNGVTGTFSDAGQDVDANRKSASLFGDAIFPLSNSVNLNVGARYAWDKTAVKWLEKTQGETQPSQFRNIPKGGIDVDDSWKHLYGRAVLDWNINDQTNLYGGVSQGYKPGGFDTNLEAGENPNEPFKKETNINYEVGTKSYFYDHGLWLATALYYNDYSNLQVQTGDPRIPGSTRNRNADAYVKGVEVDTSWETTERLTLGLTLSLSDAKYKEDIGSSIRKGQDLVNAPRFSSTVSVDYRWPVERGEVRFNTTYSYTTTQRLTNTRPVELSGANMTFEKKDVYTGKTDMLNARATFTPTGGDWDISLWGTNLLNKSYREESAFHLATLPVGGNGDLLANAKTYRRNLPRAVGMEMTYRFSE